MLIFDWLKMFRALTHCIGGIVFHINLCEERQSDRINRIKEFIWKEFNNNENKKKPQKEWIELLLKYLLNLINEICSYVYDDVAARRIERIEIIITSWTRSDHGLMAAANCNSIIN